MSESIGAPDEDVSPVLMAAEFVLGALPIERVPWRIAGLLKRGYDGPVLRELAGLGADDSRAIRDLLPSALAEVGVDLPEDALAAAIALCDELAVQMLAGEVRARQVEQTVSALLIRANYAEQLLALPLSELGFDEAWPPGMPRSEENLAEVRGLSVRQVSRPRNQLGIEET